jgi:hypothetical protein
MRNKFTAPRFTAPRFTVLAFILAALTLPSAALAETTVYSSVAELFTSQACASCPAADSLMKQKASADPGMLLLSYHVNYWDHLGWKDMFSSQASTDRQRGYYTALRENMFYTPELVVNGAVSMIGSDESSVNSALANYKIRTPYYNIEIVPVGRQGQLQALINATGFSSASAAPVEAWEVTYISYARTRIGAGENEGRTVENINNVTSITRLGTLDHGSASYQLPDFRGRKDMIAIIVQGLNQGPIYAAATYGDGAASP